MRCRTDIGFPKCCKLGIGLAATFVLCLNTAVAQTRYTVIDLGTLG